MRYVGWDLSTKRSGITLLDINTPNGYKVLARWSKGPKTNNPDAVVRFFSERVMANVFKDQPPSVVAIDWSLEEAHMKGNKRFTLLKGMVAGLVYARLKELGHMPVFIPPAQVRKSFYLPTNAAKRKVAETFADEWRLEGLSVKALNELNEHTLDALILAYVANQHLDPELRSLPVIFKVPDSY